MANPILVTGAAGRVGAVGRTVTELLLKQSKAVGAMVRNEDERAQALRDMGAEVVAGNLLDLDSMHRAIAGCETMYFGMSVSDAYLAATVNAAAVAKHDAVKAFINMSQMTVSQMSVTATTSSPQHKLHWLAEQALNWSGLPVVHVRPTVFLEGFFLTLTPDSVRESDQIKLPFGEGKTSPVAAEDVARALATVLAKPQPHIGKIYHLTGPQSENMHFHAQEYSKALGRTITFQDIPVLGTIGFAFAVPTRLHFVHDLLLEAFRASEILKPHGHTILDAVRFFTSHLDLVTRSKPFETFAQELREETNQRLESRKLRPRAAESLLETLKRMEGHFGASLLCDITPESLSSWLINLPLADRSKNRHRGYAHQIFEIALKRRYVTVNPVKAVDTFK